MPQFFGALYFHIVFSTKNRQPLIDANLQLRLYEYIRTFEDEFREFLRKDELAWDERYVWD